MVRAPFIDKNGLKKGAWSEEEDQKLRSYVQRYGHWNWRELPSEGSHNSEGEAESVLIIDTPPNIMILESSSLSPTTSSSTSELSSLSPDSGSGPISSSNIEHVCRPLPCPDQDQSGSGDFWSEPFVADNIYNQDGYNYNPTSMARVGFGLPLPCDLYFDDYSDHLLDFYQLQMQEWP
ncbi:hypothetical protein COLO4_04837 [Corchorus olitorius]|uniref:Uncharacterized protein n=1 Tax=Corchorus olitorius TaxID=93759 RepID=A0A1R3KSN9_9ROSI|nr:hypothetical protein COLO4_04837 [Corchorus olitorius]